jgi:hypothetical protein
MFNLANPVSTGVFLTGVLMGLTQWLKTKLDVDGQAAEIIALGLGVFAGALWFAAYNDLTLAPLPILGLLASALAFGLVPSGLYKLAFKSE